MPVAPAATVTPIEADETKFSFLAVWVDPPPTLTVTVSLAATAVSYAVLTVLAAAAWIVLVEVVVVSRFAVVNIVEYGDDALSLAVTLQTSFVLSNIIAAFWIWSLSINFNAWELIATPAETVYLPIPPVLSPTFKGVTWAVINPRVFIVAPS